MNHILVFCVDICYDDFTAIKFSNDQLQSYQNVLHYCYLYTDLSTEFLWINNHHELLCMLHFS